MKTAAKSPELQAALKAAHLAAAVSRVADSTGIDRTEITTPDGTQLDTFKFLDAMRARLPGQRTAHSAGTDQTRAHRLESGHHRPCRRQPSAGFLHARCEAMTAPARPLAVDVRALLQRPLSELRGFTDPDGRPLSPRQVRIALVAELASGHELLPIGTAHQFSFIKK